MKDTTGGYIYPRVIKNMVYNPETDKTIIEDHAGMTLRDYFAGQVIPSLIPDPQMSIKIQVEDAYRIADAMIKERNKE